MANMDDEIRKKHEPLCSGAGTKLGQIHRMLIDASNELQSQSQHRVDGKDVSTELGKEVGKDEIHWWVFKKEPNVEELRARTKDALTAAQKLKEDSKLLATSPSDSYDKLVVILADFLQAHAGQIECLFEYVLWLRDRNPLAPAVLYTYRVWGSTRRAERWIRFFGAGNAPIQSIDDCDYIEVVCGLFQRGLYTIARIEYEIGSEIFESLDPEDRLDDRRILIPEHKLFRRTSHSALLAFAEYLEMIRDSLRNVLLDVEKYDAQRDLMKSDIFWAKFIEKVKNLQRPEHQHWDFKRVLNMWTIRSQKEKSKSEVKFAELVAGFANAQGGVIIVGVTDTFPRTVEGIGDDQTDLERILKYTRDVISKYIIYPRDLVYLNLTPVEDGTGNKKNCLVISIAQASEAVAVRDEQDRFTYPVRHETGLSRVDRLDVIRRKVHLKADSYDFVQDFFNEMLHDR